MTKFLNIKMPLVCLFCFIASQSCAQYVANQPADTIPVKKNALGLHLNVPLSIMMTARPEYLQIGVGYKRHTTAYKSLVLQANWIPTLYDTNDDLFLIGTNDSLLLYESSHRTSNDIMFGVGMEWADYTKFISPYYGLDVLFGFGSENESKQLYKARRNDTESYAVFSAADTVHFSYATLDRKNAPAPATVKTTNYFAGVAFTLGCRVALKNRFEIWAQLTPRMIYTHSLSEFENINTGRKGSFDQNDFTLQLRLLQVLLAYKF